MEENVSNPPGNAKQRRKAKRKMLRDMGVDSTTAQVIIPQAPKPEPVRSKPPTTDGTDKNERRDRFNEFLNVFGFGCTLASWGWSVIAPDSSAIAGSILLFLGVIAMLAAVLKAWRMDKFVAGVLVIAVLVGFWTFDWHIVVKPQRGKPFKELLASGYHLTEECGNHPAKEPMPTWMRDASIAWQAQVQQLITEKLDPKDSQIWRSAVVYGLVTDSSMTAYQCYWLAEKVAALETIISTHFDPELKHRPYEGPLYWLESVDGKVDITEALKNGAGRFTIHEKPAPDSSVKVTGQVAR